MHPAALSDEALLQQCEQVAIGRSGPGGQHVNKNKTGVELRHRASGVTAQASERRERQRNVAVALQRLRLQCALHIRGGTSVDDLAPFRQGTRLPVKQAARNLPIVIAVLCDVLHEQDWDAKSSAELTGISPSQLRKVLAADSTVWQAVQQTLADRGHAPWRRPS